MGTKGKGGHGQGTKEKIIYSGMGTGTGMGTKGKGGHGQGTTALQALAPLLAAVQQLSNQTKSLCVSEIFPNS
jgi:hypothetical protein